MRLVDADKLDYTCNADECGMLTGCNHCQYSIITEDEIDSAPTVEAIPKADYENRLRADMVAMLEDLQFEIDELEVPLLYLAEDYEGGVLDCKKIIQQKINKLRGDKDGNVD